MSCHNGSGQAHCQIGRVPEKPEGRSCVLYSFSASVGAGESSKANAIDPIRFSAAYGQPYNVPQACQCWQLAQASANPGA